MERYIINGKEFEFDTFDMDNLELIQRETKRLEENTRKYQRNGNAFQFIRERAEDMLDFFETERPLRHLATRSISRKLCAHTNSSRRK